MAVVVILGFALTTIAGVPPLEARATNEPSATVSDPKLARILDKAERTLEEGSFERARKLFEKAIKSGEDSDEVLLGLSAANLGLGAFDAAIEMARHVAEGSPSSPMRSCPKILSGLPAGLNDSALAAVREWRFRPAATSDGQPMSVHYMLTVRFELSALY